MAAHAEDFVDDGKATTDQQYFDSYGLDLTVTKVMLQDAPRMDFFMKALSPAVVQGKTIIDCGAGTGILSLICARNGARRVISVEASPEMAARIPSVARCNNRHNTVTAVNVDIDRLSSIQDLILHHSDFQTSEPFCIDIIVSEWMGFYLFHEGMLRSVLHLRDLCVAHNRAMGHTPSGNMFNNSSQARSIHDADKAYTPQCIPAEGSLFGCPVDLSVSVTQERADVDKNVTDFIPPFVAYIKQRDFGCSTPQHEVSGVPSTLSNHCWGDICGFDFTVYAQMEAEALVDSVRQQMMGHGGNEHIKNNSTRNNMFIHVIPPTCCITKPRPLLHAGSNGKRAPLVFNFEETNAIDLEHIEGSITYQASELVQRNSTEVRFLSGFCLSWDVMSYQYGDQQRSKPAERQQGITKCHKLTTSPYAHATHWKQATVLLPEDLPLTVFSSSKKDQTSGDDSAETLPEVEVHEDDDTVTMTLKLIRDDAFEPNEGEGRTYLVEMELS